MAGLNRAARVGDVLTRGAQNAGALEQSNQQMGDQASAFDVWTHSYEGMSDRMRSFADDPVGTLRDYDADLDAAVEAGVTGDWHSTSMSAVGDSVAAQAQGLGAMVDAIGDAQGALATVGATFALLTGVEQMLSTLVSVIPFPAFPAIRVADMDVGLPHAHSHPPNLTPPNPVPVPLPSTGPIIPIPILSGATRTLINGMPAARCGDMGLGVWCGGYFPMYEVFLGSSSVWIEGARAGRLAVDITKHCVFTSPKPSDPPIGPMVGVTTMASANVLIGGVPMPSLLSLALGAAMKGLMGGLGRALRRLQATRLGRQVATRVANVADDVMDALGIRLGSRLRNRISRGLCTITGHPVDVATGKVFTDHVDFELPGPLPLRFERCWYSCSSYAGPLGHGWHHTLDLGLIDEPEKGLVALRLADGRHALSPRPKDGGEVFLRSEKLTLRRKGGEYELVTGEGLRYRFAPPADGRETGRGTGAGRRPEWPCTGVRDRNDNAIGLVRRDGVLTAIVDSAGRTLRVRTDERGRILAISAPHPDQAGAELTLVEYAYDEGGDLVSATDCNGTPLSYRYRDHLLVQETDRFGVSFYFEYDDDPISPRCVRTWGDGGIFERRLAYDPDAGITRVTSWSGAVTEYHWNELGLVTREIDPFGHATVTEWNEHAQKVRAVDPLGNATEYAYDEEGRLEEIKRPLGWQKRIAYDDAGNVAAVESGDGATWRWRYDGRGNRTSVVDPGGRETRFRRDRRGLNEAIVDAIGRATGLTHDDGGNLIRAVDRAGLHLTMAYDRLGRVRRQRDNVGVGSEYEWDLAGNLVAIVDSEGNRDRFAYDRAGNLVAETNAAGETTRFEYAGTRPGGQLASVLEPTGYQCWYRYDLDGHLVEVRDSLRRSWIFERDEGGRLVREVDFHGHEHRYRHDAAGQVVAWTNGAGDTTTIEWDALGRLAGQVYADGVEERYEYDAAGRLKRAVNPDAEVVYERDAAGRVTSETINGAAVVSEYDVLGNRIARVSPVGKEVRFGYDAESRITGVADGAGTLLERAHDHFGREVERRFASGHVSKRAYDPDGAVTAQSLRRPGSHLVRRDYRYDPAGRLDRIDDFGHTTWLEHDAAGRLIRADREGRSTAFPRDPAGNPPGLAAAVSRDGPSTPTEVAGWMLVHDASGNLVEKRKGGQRHRYRYDSAGRLTEAEAPDGETVRFTYDALGRRLSKRGARGTVHYMWDQDQLLAETVEPGERRGGRPEYREYVFDGLRPLCVLGAGTEAWLLETDHIERPIVALDRTGAVAWTGSYDAAGNLEGDAGEFLPFRYPGQIHDPETGLSYNRLRYFDPELGIYTQPDPIGLRGGLAPFSYVRDPNTWADPFGLMPHEMEGWIERGGEEVPGTRRNVESGGLTQEEAGRYGLNSHTERKYLNAFGDEIQPGDTVRMRGELDPCQPGCRPALRDTVDRTGASVVYESSSTGRTWTLRPAADGEFPRARADVVLEVSENGKVVSRHRYYRSASGRWVRKPC